MTTQTIYNGATGDAPKMQQIKYISERFLLFFGKPKHRSILYPKDRYNFYLHTQPLNSNFFVPISVT